ncbi:MAG: phenylalanine--tRNA ligase subunit beta [Patescibacteria group bacterium]
MLISYNWLQSYFDETLPEPEKLGELLTFASFELEGIEKKGSDTILDLKVLPDRACYALSHRGMGYEVAAITGLAKKKQEQILPPVGKTRPFNVRVEDSDLCARYMARVIENVTQRELPVVKERLQSVGQRSINPVVDSANFVMLDRGQPLHAFDADKVKGDIVVRRAKTGEKIITLDNREVDLDETILIIADEEAPLAIAGIKGGKRAEVTSSTKNLILESASFNASYIRKTSDKLGIRTDASKRYENKFSADMTSKGMNDFSALLFEMDSQILAGEVIDIYSNVLQNIGIDITAEYISNRLGLDLPEEVIVDVLRCLKIEVKKRGKELILTPPIFRADLLIPEDIAEEVGRIVGYDKVPATLPPVLKMELEIPKQFYYEWKIREILANAGFSEVMTSSFSSSGEIAIEKPLAEDKKFTRPNLRNNFAMALKLNFGNASLFGSEEIKIFEIGKVFGRGGEHAALAVGFAGPKKKVASELSAVVALLSEKLGCNLEGETKDGIFETNLDKALSDLPQPKSSDVLTFPLCDAMFKPFSVYPFIVRDIALFVPAGTDSETIHQLILGDAGDFVVHSKLFDRFEKDGKVSYGFRLVFQSMGRTLTDEEINKVMEKVYETLKAKGWEIR